MGERRQSEQGECPALERRSGAKGEEIRAARARGGYRAGKRARTW
jgi:hypothetical protein